MSNLKKMWKKILTIDEGEAFFLTEAMNQSHSHRSLSESSVMICTSHLKSRSRQSSIERFWHEQSIILQFASWSRSYIASPLPAISRVPAVGSQSSQCWRKMQKMAIDRNCSNLESRVFLRNSERVNTSIKAWRPIPRNTSEQGLQPALP